MSNQVGDHYTCSNSDCGCEIEIERPCSMLSEESMAERSSTDARYTGSSSPMPSSPSSSRLGSSAERSSYGMQSDRELRSAKPSTPGDYGEQGARSEGNFGTSGPGDANAIASDRYESGRYLARTNLSDTDERRATSKRRQPSTTAELSGAGAPRSSTSSTSCGGSELSGRVYGNTQASNRGLAGDGEANIGSGSVGAGESSFGSDSGDENWRSDQGSPQRRRSSNNARTTLICFCGSEMRPTGSGQA